jgi:long-subunit acyl-CoA synthetase (AMP-forming)
MEMKLLDDDGKEVKMGEPGEIFIRGPNVCLGYWRNDEATKECIDSDQWLKTGDVAVVDKRHNFWIVDRKKVRLCLSTQGKNANLSKGTDQSQRIASCACGAGSRIAGIRPHS